MIVDFHKLNQTLNPTEIALALLSKLTYVLVLGLQLFIRQMHFSIPVGKKNQKQYDFH